MNKQERPVSKLYARLCILFFYLISIILFLHIPTLSNFFLPSKNTLNIYTFTDNFKPELIVEFERLYNVKVNIKYFDSNEELFAQFKINRGKGYDLVTPSDYMVELLRKDGLLYKLDKKQISVFTEIDSKLLGLYYDPLNDYSVPFNWVPYGIVYRKDIFKENPKTINLSLLFEDPNLLNNGLIQPYRICMSDDYREAIFFASLYLRYTYGSVESNRLLSIKNCLIQQKKWVESYTNQDLRYYLLADIVKVALAPTVFVRKILEQSDDFDFKIPEEGGLISIENIVIPAGAENILLAYKFINFVLSKDISFKNSQFYGVNPANRYSYLSIDKKILDNVNLFPQGDDFNKLSVLHNNIPTKEYEDVWLAVKSE